MQRNVILFGGPEERLNIAKRQLSTSDLEIYSFHESEKYDIECSRVIAIWTELMPTIDQKVLDRFENVKFIFTSTTGVDHLDLEALKARQIQLVTLREIPEVLNNITSTSELTWCLILAVWRNLVRNLLSDIPQELSAIRERFVAFQLSGKTLGLIGFGRIGKQLSAYGHCFGLNIYAYDPFARLPEVDFNNVIFVSNLRELLERSDVVVICASKQAKADAIIGKRELEWAKANSIFVNTARGGLWNETAVAEALVSGKISGVGVDVYQAEETSDSFLNESPLLHLDDRKYNIVRTPHIGGATLDALELVTKSVALEISKMKGKLIGN
jgi:D-3-phosphoglycerate dehydrogenase